MGQLIKKTAAKKQLKLMLSVWQKIKILQEINYIADRQERSFESRTSLSRGPLQNID